MKKVLNSLFISGIIVLTSCSINTGKIIESRSYFNEELNDYTPVFLKMIEDAKKNNISKINIDSGTYHFYPDKAYEKYCCISNHDNGLRRTPFPIIGFDGLEIQADNARFIFHGLMLPFIIEDSRNISLSGFSIDWELPLASEALVVANNNDNKTFDIRISSSQPYEIRNNELIFLKEGYEHNLDRSIYWDPETRAVAYNTVSYAPGSVKSEPSITQFLKVLEYPYGIDPKLPVFDYRGKSTSVFAEELEPGLIRVSYSGKLSPPKTGLVLVCKGQNGYNRWAPAIHINKSDNIALSDVSIFSAGGMGVIAEMSSNISLDSVKVEPSPGTGRMLSTSADATHFVNCRGLIRLNNSVFSNQLDDATNVHGTYLKVTESLGENKIGAMIGHFQQLGFDFAEPGDEIAFVNYEKSLKPEFTSKLKKINKVNDRYYIMEFESNISLSEDDSFIIENLSAYPELEITNCRIVNNRARGILLSTPKRILVENNYFSTMMSAILVPVELSWWFESGIPSDLTIRNNIFGDCCYGGGRNSVINIHSASPDKGSDFANIVIENNQFKSFDAATLSANKVEKLIFKGNTIHSSNNYEPFSPKSAVISVIESSTVTIEENEFKSGFENTLHLDESTRSNANILNNKGL